MNTTVEVIERNTWYTTIETGEKGFAMIGQKLRVIGEYDESTGLLPVHGWHGDALIAASAVVEVAR
jgi:hypothetical protein